MNKSILDLRYVFIPIIAGVFFASGAGCGSGGSGTQTATGGAAGTAHGGAGGQAGTGGAGGGASGGAGAAGTSGGGGGGSARGGQSGTAGPGQGGQGGATGNGGTGGQSASCETNANCPSGQVCYKGTLTNCVGPVPGTCVTRESATCGQFSGAGCPCLALPSATTCTGQLAYCAGSDDPGQCWACKLVQ